MEKYRKQSEEKGLPTDDETVVLFAMFPQQIEALYKPKNGSPAATPTQTTVAVPASAPALSARVPSGNGRRMFVTVQGRRHEVTVEALEI